MALKNLSEDCEDDDLLPADRLPKPRQIFRVEDCYGAKAVFHEPDEVATWSKGRHGVIIECDEEYVLQD